MPQSEAPSFNSVDIFKRHVNSMDNTKFGWEDGRSGSESGEREKSSSDGSGAATEPSATPLKAEIGAEER